MARTGATVLAEMLEDYGVCAVFFVPTILLPTLAALEGRGVRRVMAHGEKAAAYMADGYARAARAPGVCFAQHIGSTNLLAGLRDAYLAGSPVVAVTGGSSGNAYRHAYQEVEDASQFDTLTKFNAAVDDVRRLPDLVRHAFRAATSGAPGPVHLRIGGKHGGLLDQRLDDTDRVQVHHARVPAARGCADAESVASAAAALLAARRPIIVAGGGCVLSGAEADLRTLAERLSIPVATSMDAKAVLPDDHPLNVGVVGTYSRRCANQAVSEADLVFFAGTRAGGQVTHEWRVPPADRAAIHLTNDPSEAGRNYPHALPLVADARETLQALARAVPSAAAAPHREWARHCAGLVAAWRAQMEPRLASDATPVRPERICAELSVLLPEQAIVVADTGHAGMWTGACLSLTRPGQRFLRAAGSLGWAFPAAIGAKCACPDATVVCFTGDGGFFYHLQELETAARCGIGVVVVVNNNGALAQEIPMFDAAYGQRGNRLGSEMWQFRPTDFAQIARNLGCAGIRVETPDQLRPALARALASGGPTVIDVVSDPGAYADKAWAPGD